MDSSLRLGILVLVVGLIVGGGIGYYVVPPPTLPTPPSYLYDPGLGIPLAHSLISIGYISSDTTALETGKPYHEQVIAEDLKVYLKLLGYGTTFRYLVDDAQGDDNRHLEKLQGFKSMDVNLFEGGGWDSQAERALSYVNENNMLMWSPSSTSPALEIENDRLYRMCPSDSALPPALTEVMWSYGMRDVVVLHVDDPKTNEVVKQFTLAWAVKGGELASAPVRIDAGSESYSLELLLADTQALNALKKYPGGERVATLLLASSEAPAILRQVGGYPSLSSTVLFWDGETAQLNVVDGGAGEANRLRVFGISPREPSNTLYDGQRYRFENLTKLPFSVEDAYSYDIGFLIVNTIVLAQSHRADDIVALQSPTAYSTFGATGWERLNGYGDRSPPPFDVWYYASFTGGAAHRRLVGTYDPEYNAMWWSMDVIPRFPGP